MKSRLLSQGEKGACSRRGYQHREQTESDRPDNESENRRILHWQIGHYRKSSNLFTNRNTTDAKGFRDSPNPDSGRVKNLLKIKGTFRFFFGLALNGMGINHRGSHITVTQQFLNGTNVIICL